MNESSPFSNIEDAIKAIHCPLMVARAHCPRLSGGNFPLGRSVLSSLSQIHC